MPSDPEEKPAVPARRRLYLMRHGDVDYFDARGRPHRPDAVPLNDEGRQQAEAARDALADLPLDRVVSSSLVRSRETAAVVAEGRSVEAESLDALAEIRPGRLADIPPEGIEAAFLSAFGKKLTAESRFLGGETFGSLVQRVTVCLGELLGDRSWRYLLVVAHGAVNRAILGHALGLGLEGFARIEQDAGCINILDVGDDGHWIVRLVNFTPQSPVKKGLELTTMERLWLQYRRPGEGETTDPAG